jgi:protocatechuate 3,4-dioxygenase beta subunit
MCKTREFIDFDAVSVISIPLVNTNMSLQFLYRLNGLSLILTILLVLAGRSGQQCVPSTTVTPEDLLGPFYVANSEMSNRIAPDELLSDPTLRFFVYGKVLNSSTCVGIPNIVVEAWYAGPPDSDGDYYQTNEFRGQVTTNELGEYNFTQTFPELYPTRPILHNHFRLSTLSGEELLVTQMYFYGSGNGYVTDRTSRKRLIRLWRLMVPEVLNLIC